jgi:hypothetical protein
MKGKREMWRKNKRKRSTMPTRPYTHPVCIGLFFGELEFWLSGIKDIVNFGVIILSLVWS